MGYLTTVILRNDAMGSFEDNPEAFGRAILAGIHKAQEERAQVDIPFNGYCNYISVELSRHADDETVYVHTGNMVFNLHPEEKDFKDLAKQNKTILADFIRRAERIIKTAKIALKQYV